ncbi:MAG: hypothetical protein V7K48_08640 [Nostoc sp.]|uniref:hypothetical protein n=1 Tax=Nostoc sp. TaxID=1180 RepID=UPI002FF57E53
MLCIDVIANPKNSELFALCKCREGRRRDESLLYKGGDRKNDRIPILFVISVLPGAMSATGYAYAFPGLRKYRTR